MPGGVIDKAMSLSKFRGALVGALLGDCLGSPFEGDEKVSKVVLQKYFDKMENPAFKSPHKKFTDDTAMTKAIAQSLVQNVSFNEVDVAKRFVMDFFSDCDRGYGANVVEVFKKLRNNKFTDVWKPAQEQFSGSGSNGNGGAMRVAPIPLFFNSNYQSMLETATKCTKITHTHRLGINGALLQAIAIHESYLQPPNEDLNVEKYLSNLIEKITSIEEANRDEVVDDERSYLSKLLDVQELLRKEDPSDEEVLELLGNGVQAYYSVPTAIYCFLRAQKPIQNIEVTRLQKSYSNFDPFKTDNKFRRAVQYSISLGGDTDTIASMAGAVSGAYHGYEYINKELQSHCEGLDEILKLAEDLHSKAPS